MRVPEIKQNTVNLVIVIGVVVMAVGVWVGPMYRTDTSVITGLQNQIANQTALSTLGMGQLIQNSGLSDEMLALGFPVNAFQSSDLFTATGKPPGFFDQVQAQQQGNVCINVVVVDTNNSVVAGASVTLTPPNNQVVFMPNTNSNGTSFITNAKDATYIVVGGKIGVGSGVNLSQDTVATADTLAGQSRTVAVGGTNLTLKNASGVSCNVFGVKIT